MGSLFRHLGVEHVLGAIKEFGQLGRTVFLKRYGFSRSSKFYLLHRGQIYDTKSLLAATYFHAYGRRLSNERFGGGEQTIQALDRMIKSDDRFKKAEIFEDKLGELSFLSDEYHQLSQPHASIRSLGFSKWIPLSKFKQIKTGFLPGVYIIGHRVKAMGRLDQLDKKVIYIGETVSQNLHKRLYQLNRSLDGKDAHSGGSTLHGLQFRPSELSFSIRSFTLSFAVDSKYSEMQRSSLIRFLERKLLYEYVNTNGKYPAGNSK